MNSEILLLLSNFEGISKNNYTYIISRYHDCKEFFQGVEKRDENIFKYIKEEHKQEAQIKLCELNLQKILKDMQNTGIKYLQKDGDLLYYIGDISLLDKKKAVFFGSRNCSSSAIDTVQHICEAFAEYDLAVICGLAYGIDEAVQRNCKNSIGVCCGGLLGQTADVKSYGLCLSLSGLYMPPLKYLYNARNDYMMQISDCAVIIEAGDGSGTLKFLSRSDGNKKILCCPSSMINVRGLGSNRYILENPDSIAVSPQAIISYLLGEKILINAAKEKKCSKEEQLIIDLILKNYNTYEQLKNKFSGSADLLNETLMLMEIKGMISKAAGNRYEVI